MRDPILAGLLVAVRQSSGLQLPLTILSRGLVIEGDLVAESRWLDELAALLEQGTEATSALGAVFRDAGAAAGMAAVMGDETGALVHLVQATIHAAGENVSTGLWRLRADAVDGWRLGRPVTPLRSAAG